jgi:organic radical activating enzyme
MKSLQVLTPARKCIFNCPFCIAKTHHHQNNFINNFEYNYQLWEDHFINLLEENRDLQTVVITGTNEPLQDLECIKVIISIIRKIRDDIKIELQTRVYKKEDVFNLLDVVAFSISAYNNLNKVDIIDKITHYVIILTDSFNNKSLDDIINETPINVSQLTFKVLHDSDGYNANIDNWVSMHRINQQTITKLKEDISNYKGNASILFDEHCMNAENRYMVFREDGYLYHDFENQEACDNFNKGKVKVR